MCASVWLCNATLATLPARRSRARPPSCPGRAATNPESRSGKLGCRTASVLKRIPGLAQFPHSCKDYIQHACLCCLRYDWLTSATRCALAPAPTFPFCYPMPVCRRLHRTPAPSALPPPQQVATQLRHLPERTQFRSILEVATREAACRSHNSPVPARCGGGEQRAPVRSACGRLLADQPMLIPARLPSCLTTASCGTRHMPLPCPTLHVQVAFFQPPHPAINTIAAGRCSMPNPRARYT